MPNRPLVSIICLLVSWAAGPETAVAHPHVWIDARLAVTFDADDQIRSLTVTWRLDELYSQTSLAGLDENGDGHYEESELRPMIDEAMRNLDEWFYFTDIRVDGIRLKTAPVETYRAFMDGERLVYQFTLPLAKPLKPTGTGLRVRLFDPSLFIGIDLEKKDPITLAGASMACAHDIAPAPGFEESLLIGESAFAQEVEPGTDGPGGRFAQTVTIRCD